VKKLITIGLVLFVSIPLGVLLTISLISPTWLADKVSQQASSMVSGTVDIKSINPHPWSLHPEIMLTDLSVTTRDEQVIKVDSASGKLDLIASLSGKLRFDQLKVLDARVTVRRNNEGDINILQLRRDGTVQPDASSGPMDLPVIEQLVLENISLSMHDSQSNISSELNVDAHSSTMAGMSTSLSATGTLNQVPLKVSLETMALSELVQRKQPVEIDTSLTLGETRLTIAGVIHRPQDFRALDMDVELVAPALDDLARASNFPLPVIPPLTLNGALKRDEDDLILRRFDGTLGDSDIEGDSRIDLSTQPIIVYANVISRRLDLDDLAGFVGARSDNDESAVVDDRSPPAAPKPARLLPDKPLNLNAFINAMNGAIRYRALSVDTELWPVDSLDIRFEFEPDRLSISPVKLGVAGGVVNASLSVEIAEASAPSGTAEFRAQLIDLNEVFRSVDLDKDSFGAIGGRGKYWVSGDTIADLVASADGGMFMLMTGGKIDALLTEMAGLDAAESLALLIDPGKSRTDIRCAYLDIHSRSGLFDINRFILDTNDTLFITDGTIDMNTEQLDLLVEPHTKDVSLLSAQTAFIINGSLTAPSVSPGPALAGRSIAAAVLAAVATPVAALLPFIQTGAEEHSPYCNGLTQALDEAR